MCKKKKKNEKKKSFLGVFLRRSGLLIHQPRLHTCHRVNRVPANNLIKCLVIIIAENILMATPMPRVNANPFTKPVENQNKMRQVKSVEACPSRTDGHA